GRAAPHARAMKPTSSPGCRIALGVRDLWQVGTRRPSRGPGASMHRDFETTFFMTGAISRDWESCQFPFVLDEKATVVAGGAVGKRRERHERFFIAPLGRSQSEPRRRLALASGFALFRLSGINRIDAPGSAAGRAGRPRWARILTITGGSSMAALRQVSRQAMIFKLPPPFGHCSMSMSKTRLISLAQLMRARAP